MLLFVQSYNFSLEEADGVYHFQPATVTTSALEELERQLRYYKPSTISSSYNNYLTQFLIVFDPTPPLGHKKNNVLNL